MKNITASSLFLLSVLVTGTIAATPLAFADHPEAVLEPLEGSATAGCQDTDEGCYNIPILTVAPGTEIVFSNTDIAAHTLTAGSPSEGTTGEFDSGLLVAGATYSFTLDEEGTYNHYCLVHPWMTGQIIVDASAKSMDDHMEDDHSMDDAMMDDSMMMDDAMMDDESMMDDSMMMDDAMMDDESMMDDSMMMDDAMMDDESMMDDSMMADDESMMADEETGGCLIATATFGSEMAPQVQNLREFRDNTVLATASGTAFMSGFNQLYYTFSPTVADLERQNPVLRDTIKVGLTPMLSSLTLLNHVNIDTEAEMLGYGISVIMLNIGMYVGAPAVAILLCAKMVRTRLHRVKPQNG